VNQPLSPRSNPTAVPEPPEALILGPRGLMDLGEIDAAAAKAAGIPVGPIRLQNGTTHWGWRHVQENQRRMRDISARGYATAIAFSCDVAANWTRLHQGEGQKITAVRPLKGFDLALALRWTGTFWSITTMLPFRTIGTLPLLYQKVEAA